MPHADGPTDGQDVAKWKRFADFVAGGVADVLGPVERAPGSRAFEHVWVCLKVGEPPKKRCFLEVSL